MDGLQFDGLTRSLTKSRRSLLGGALALAGAWHGVADSDARKKHKKKRKKTKKPQPNANGCLNVGAACQSEEQCCSGVCEGKKGERSCRSHDTDICNVQSDLCSSGEATVCGTNNLQCAC